VGSARSKYPHRCDAHEIAAGVCKLGLFFEDTWKIHEGPQRSKQLVFAATMETFPAALQQESAPIWEQR
jgi:hypothetical protein